ncbi:MAG: AAA family ATPase [Treponemataceae bacterium]
MDLVHDDALFEECTAYISRCHEEIEKRIVGQKDIVSGIMIALIAGGHVLLEGVPGLAKTLLVKTFSDISGFDFKRIQFTPDLLPADLIGTLFYEQAKAQFSIRQGPVFTNLVLADEINRSPAKVQSALLEAMAERQVTIGDTTLRLPNPFFVLATQNPIEQEGTYNLPEAELDRFLMKLILPYPSITEEIEIVKKMDSGDISLIPVEKVFTLEVITKIRTLISTIVCDDKIIEYLVSLVAVTRPDYAGEKISLNKLSGAKNRDDVLKYLSFGASPRATIALLQCAKIAAFFAGRHYVLPDDVKLVAPSVLRHRIVLSYEASADGLTSDTIIEKILSVLPLP